MKPRTIALTMVLCFVGAAVCFAQDPNLGTWKLNEAKSKLGPGATKNATVVYEAMGDSMKVTVDGTDASGNAVHNEWTGKFDGKAYPLTGNSRSDSRTYRRINPRTLAFTEMKGGKVTASGRIAVAMDGKSRTVTSNGTNSQGQRFHAVAVYDKQ